MANESYPMDVMEVWHNELVQKGVTLQSAADFSQRVDRETMRVGRQGVSHKIAAHMAPAGDISLHAAIYRHYPKINAIIGARQPGIMTVAQTNARNVRPLLDDFTQIIGTTVKIVDTAASKSDCAVVRALARRNAVMLRGEGALCCAESFDEALAVALILEKNCKALIEASFLGGGKAIPLHEALLMRFIYLRKYSRMK